jgi:hypothetical protein
VLLCVEKKHRAGTTLQKIVEWSSNRFYSSDDGKFLSSTMESVSSEGEAVLFGIERIGTSSFV